MFAGVASAGTVADPWRFSAHPEVWLLVAFVVGMGFYITRVIAPKVFASGSDATVSTKQRAWFAAGVITLWLASDWPVHDIAEDYLYTVHMVQHLVLTYVAPPMFWLAMPEWLARLLVPRGTRTYRAVRKLGGPIVAGLLFNVMVAFTHWSVIVNTSVRIGPFHYVVHLLLVSSALVMWLPVVSPWKEFRLSPIGQCMFLFMISMLPTLPGAWLSLAESPLYEVYDHEPRLWGLSVIEDQTAAGLFMKVFGGAYLWAVIIAVFFRWGLAEERENRRGCGHDGVGEPRAPTEGRSHSTLG